MTKRDKTKYSWKELAWYGACIVIFVGLALTFDSVEFVSESDLSETDNANTIWVQETIDNDPLSSPAGSRCSETPIIAERTKTGFPMTLYETAREEPCGRASGVSHPTQRNQIINTIIAGVAATTICILPRVVRKARS